MCVIEWLSVLETERQKLEHTAQRGREQSTWHRETNERELKFE